MKTIAIIQARMNSERLPGKTLLPIAGTPILGHVINRTQQINGLDDIIVATGAKTIDDPIEAYCRGRGTNIFRGSPNDVLNRYRQCARDHKADIILRITADCPLLDPLINTLIVATTQTTRHNYVTASGYPNGLAQETFTADILEQAWQEAEDPDEREHVVPWIITNGNPKYITTNPANWPDAKFSIDTKQDLYYITQLHEQEPNLFNRDAAQICQLATKEPAT